MVLSIASINLGLHDLDPNLINQQEIDDLYSLCGVDGSFPVDFEIRCTGFDSSYAQLLINTQKRSTRDFYYESGPVVTIFDKWRFSSINWQTRVLTVAPIPGQPSRCMDLAGEIKCLCGLIAIEKGGFPLHCSAISFNTDAYAFLGESGSGKTTIMNILCPPGTPLNEDFNIILPAKKGFSIYSTPFKTNGAQCTAPNSHNNLERLFVLRKALINSIDTLTTKERIFSIAKNVYALQTSNAMAEKLFSNIESVNNIIPVEQLSFIKNSTITTFLEAAVFIKKPQFT